MKLVNGIALAAAASALAACSVVRERPRGAAVARVNPSSIAASPAAWDGRQVEMVGLLVWEFGDLSLYQSHAAYCRGGERTALYVDWSVWPSVTRADSRRQVMVRGTFRNRQGVVQADGSREVSNAASGPGPLEPGGVVRWLSAPLKPCPAVRP